MRLILKNKNNQELDLFYSPYFKLVGAEALHGVEVEYGESDSPYIDGTIIDNVKALPRSIELTFALTGDVKTAIKHFTSYVKSKQTITLIERDTEKEIEIKGVANIPPYSRMEQLCKITLSVYCEEPYWQDAETMINDIALVIDMLNFPLEGQYFTTYGRPFGAIDTRLVKDFENDGDESVGMKINILAYGEVVNPRISCSTGEQNGNYMQLNLTLQDNDYVEINTTKGNKYITINGSEEKDGEPILNSLEFTGKDWLQLEQGLNTFNVSVESGEENIVYTISYKRKYE